MILVSKFQPNISQSLTLYWETQFAKIGVYLFMECESIEIFENDVFGLSPIKLSMPLYLCALNGYALRCQGKYSHLLFSAFG